MPGKTSKIRFVCLIPRTIENRQRIFDISYSVPPSRIYDTHGNRYAEFTLLNPNRYVEIQIRVKAQLIRYDLVAAYANGSKASEDIPRKYLASEKFLAKDDPAILRVSRNIRIEPTDIATIRNVFDYVLRTLEYGGYSEVDLGAAEALMAKRGDCTEYVDLFVTLCRAKGIPARIAEGYCIEGVGSYGHAWAEVYVKLYGWIPFDPTFADLKGVRFDRLRPIYIYLSNVRNDKELGNFHCFAYWYEGDTIKVTHSFKLISSLDST